MVFAVEAEARRGGGAVSGGAAVGLLFGEAVAAIAVAVGLGAAVSDVVAAEPAVVSVGE